MGNEIYFVLEILEETMDIQIIEMVGLQTVQGEMQNFVKHKIDGIKG
jgi:hypothetical protein